MEEKRCPVCKKYNPPGEDTCLFCGNSLVPGEIIPPGELNGEEIAVPDWLKDFKENDQADTGDTAGSTPVDHKPEWLQRIRDLNSEKPEVRNGYQESGEQADENEINADIPAVNPSGLQEWLNKLHRLENPEQTSKVSSENPWQATPESAGSQPEHSKQLQGDEEKYAGDYVEEYLSEELTASPDEDMDLSSQSAEISKGEEPELASLPVQIQEQSLMADINDYQSGTIDEGSGGSGLPGQIGLSYAVTGWLSKWKQKISGVFGGISFLKIQKTAGTEDEAPGGDLEVDTRTFEQGPIPAGEDFSSAVEESTTPSIAPAADTGEEETIDLQIEEGQKELALSAGLLDAPVGATGSVPDNESKEIPAFGQPVASDLPSSPGAMDADQDGGPPTQFTPPVKSSRLINITEKQLAYRDLLQDLLREELEPRPLPGKTGKIGDRLLRLAAALVVIVGVALPLFFTNSATLPAFVMPVSSQQQAFYQQIEALPANAPVLAAFDYEAAFSGELRPIALNVIEHLLQKQARIVTVSTVPSGTILAEDVYTQVRLDRGLSAAVSNDEYINLGYLPGGVASLKQLSIQPKQASPYGLSSAVDKQPSWSKPALQGMSSLSDFSLVIVMTDNLETAKSWVEQVQPGLGEIPLLLVTSAQAGPLLNPYLISGQSYGMVSGYAGNLAYEQLLKDGLTNPSAFMAYRTGMYLLLVALIIGAFLKVFKSISSGKTSVQGKGTM